MYVPRLWQKLKYLSRPRATSRAESGARSPGYIKVLMYLRQLGQAARAVLLWLTGSVAVAGGSFDVPTYVSVHGSMKDRFTYDT